ncbi:MAG: phosphoribosylglycinamide formyltransferase [Thiovulaceae bacterium]|nr:phosphoribosylglycinamide formyltransferase [Sulfurimonadaceae bacterium]
MLNRKIVILFSGEGSNLLAIIEKLHRKELEVVAAITNRPDAGGIAKARAHHLPVHIIDHTLYADRESFDRALLKQIQAYSPDLVVMAGFMRILTPIITENIKAINVHPSLLPLFKGGKAIKESFESAEPTGGISVHWVSSELDSGEIIAQEAFSKEADETLESFSEKIRILEHTLLPKTIVQILKAL